MPRMIDDRYQRHLDRMDDHMQVIQEGYVVVKHLGASTPEGVMLRCILVELTNRIEGWTAPEGSLLRGLEEELNNGETTDHG